MIQLNVKPGDKCCELGGGANPLVRPNFDCRMLHNAQGEQMVDAVVDFNQPLPLSDNEWDGIFCQYALEHIAWRHIQNFLKEVFRIAKPGAKVVFITANTEAQVNWAVNNSNGWDGKDFFESISQLLFGDNDYLENTHRVYFDKNILTKLFTEAGFSQITITDYGARNTDVAIQCVKPAPQAVAPMQGGRSAGGIVPCDPYVGGRKVTIDKNKLRTLLGVPQAQEFVGQTVEIEAEKLAELMGVGVGAQETPLPFGLTQGRHAP